MVQPTFSTKPREKHAVSHPVPETASETGQEIPQSHGASLGMPAFLHQLTVSTPDDASEQEADRVADAVTHVSAPTTPPSIQALSQTARKTPEPARDAIAHLQRSPSHGKPLPLPTRTRYESAFGRSFAHVRVHTRQEAADLNQALQAHAFTRGSDIYFARGQYDPSSASGQHLLAHELTHVVQQNHATSPSETIQRQEAAPIEGQTSPGAQSFGFSEEEMERRLASTPPEGAAAPAEDVALDTSTESTLDDVESEEGAGAGDVTAGGNGGGEGEESKTPADAEAEAAAAEQGEGGAGDAGMGDVSPPGTGMPPPGPASAFESLVDSVVASFLDGNVSEMAATQFDSTTQALLEGADALSQRTISEPEPHGFLASVTGIGPLADAFTEVSPGYEEEETWLQVLAQIRDITSALGGVVGIIGLVATVSGLILSLLVPPVGAFLLTAGRFCDIAALILDAISLVLGIILTGYNLYRLKNATDPEEKARLLGLVKQDAMKTVMSGIAVATAVAPGAAKMIGNTRWGRAAGAGLGRAASWTGGRIAGAARTVAGSGFGRAVGRSFVGRGARAVGGFTARVGRGAAGLGRRGIEFGRRQLTRLRGTGPIRWANRVTGQLEDRARLYFRNLATRNTRVGRFYNRRIRGFHERNVQTARMMNEPIERAYQAELGTEMRTYLRQLQQQGITDMPTLQSRIQQRFGLGVVQGRQFNIRLRANGPRVQSFGGLPAGVTPAQMQARLDQLVAAGHTDLESLYRQLGDEFNVRGLGTGQFTLRRSEGRVIFGRMDDDVRDLVRSREFTEIQLIRERFPHANADELVEHVNRSPFIQGKWNLEEMQAFTSMHGTVRQPGGAMVMGLAPKTPHHTIPAQMAPAIHRDPRFMQVVNDERFYDDFLERAYPASTYDRIPRVEDIQVPGARPGTTRRARTRQEALQGLIARDNIAVPNGDPDFFMSPQFYRELREQGSSGVWVNPRDTSQRYLFNPHQVIGHQWRWGDEIMAEIFDLPTRMGLRNEPLRQLLEPALRQGVRTYRDAKDASQDVEVGADIGSQVGRSNPLAAVDAALNAAGPIAADIAPPGETTAPPMSAPTPGMAAAAMPAVPALPSFLLGGFRNGEPPGAAPTPRPGSGGSESFLASLSARMMQPVLAFASPTPGAPATSLDGGGTRAERTTEAVSVAESPQAPPTPVPYSLQSLIHIRASRDAVAGAIEAVQAYIAQTQQTERDNTLAKEAAAALKAHNEEQQAVAASEQQDVAEQQDKLTQSKSAQETMKTEQEKASEKSGEGKSEGESVQSEGGEVTVEAKPEEPRKKSWLERAWDATVGAAWDALVQPVINAAKRKIAQVMQSINEFIMKMISQALGLDEIEAELAAGGEDIQARQANLGETDAGLTESQTQAATEQEQNQTTMDQADGNIAEAQAMRSDAEQLLAALLAHHDVLQAEEDAGTAYVSAFGNQYNAFFEQAGAPEEGTVQALTPEEAPESETPSDEPRVSLVEVMPVVSYIETVQSADQRAAQELHSVAAESAGSIAPDMQGEEHNARTAAFAELLATQSDRTTRLARLKAQAMQCVGLPMTEGQQTLETIMEELLLVAEDLERSRMAALQTFEDVHTQATLMQAGAEAIV